MPVILMIFGSILAAIGFVLLVRAIIGRKVSDHPYCRGCRYDLVGLDLTTQTPCPECGEAVLIDSRSVINGKRRTRFLLLPIALVMMIVGSAGFGYPTLKRHPSLEYVNWHVLYEQSPEPALRLYIVLNDEDAGHELWRRWTKGEISDKGLRVLIDRAMLRIADPSAKYDHRGGSVLLYAMYDGQLTEREQRTFIEGSVVSQIHMHELQSSGTTKVYAQISHHGVERFMGSWIFTIPLQRKDRPIVSISATSDFVIQCTPKILTINGIAPSSQPNWTSTSHDWAAIEPEFETSRIHFPFPIDESTLDVVIAVDYALTRNDTLVHAWQQTIYTSILRATGPVEHAQHIEDPVIINPILSNLSVGSVFVPTRIDIARGAKHRRNIRPAISFFSAKLFDHTLLGNIRFRIENDEIPYQSIEWNPKPRTHSPRDYGASIDYAQGWRWYGLHEFDESLAYFDQHHTFWQQAIEIGKIDILIIPDPAMALRDPRITSFINRPIIFKNVPIAPQVPRILSRISSLTGQPVEVLRWNPLDSAVNTRTNPVIASLLHED